MIFMLRKTISAVLGLLLSAGLVGAVAAPASAGSGACAAYYNCVWDQNNYDGAYAQVLNNNSSWSWAMSDGSGADNRADSVSANHVTSCRSFFYENGSYGGHYIYFFRAGGGTSRDPNLSNGGGEGSWSGESWSNRISSNQYVASGC